MRRASIVHVLWFLGALTGAAHAKNSDKRELQSELHWSVTAGSPKEIIDRLGLKLKGRDERDTSYFDGRRENDGDFENYAHGVTLRLRSKLDSLKKSSTAKIKVGGRDELIKFEAGDENEKYKCEEDRYDDHASFACSLTRGFFGGVLDNIEKFFSDNQKDFLQKHAPEKIDWANLKFLGPVRDLVWIFDFDGDHELELESMQLPNSTVLYELSMRIKFAGAQARMFEIEQWLVSRGIKLAAKQDSKTRQILEFFSGPSQ